MEVKKGDKVFVYSRYGRLLSEVSDITPKGFVRINGLLFNPQTGKQRTSDRWSYASFSVASPEEIEQYNRDNFILKVKKMLKDDKFISNNITYDKAVAIYNILADK